MSGPDKVFNVRMLPAGEGDCLWIDYGSADAPRRILYDCGTKDSWPMLRSRIIALKEARPTFELLVISHIDRDHIGGALSLLRARHDLNIKFKDIWFNDYRHLDDGLGFPEAIALTRELESKDLKRRWNKKFGGAAVSVDNGKLKKLQFSGMSLTVVSPGSKQLAKLAPGWEKAIAALKAKTPPAAADDDMLGGVARTSTKPLRIGKDGSKPNGSSIAVVAEFNGSRVLLAADAFPAILRTSLETLGKGKPYRLDAYKVSHHGSRANISAALLGAFDCRHFLFSSDGHGGRPHEETLSMIRAHVPKASFYFNYSPDHVKSWIKNNSSIKDQFKAVFTKKAKYRISIKLRS